MIVSGRFSEEYPPVFGAVDHLYNNSIGQCTETQYICSAQITPPVRKFWTVDNTSDQLLSGEQNGIV